MLIQLVKEVTEKKRTFYHVAVDEKIQANTITDCFAEAMDSYEKLKLKLSGKRVEVLMQETI